MAVTFISGKNKPINAYDVDNTQVTYSVISQPGNDITGFNNAATSVSLSTSSAITGVPRPISVWVLQGGGQVQVASVSLKEDGVDTELLTDATLEDISNWTVTATTDNNDGTFTMDGSSANAKMQQDVALTANRKYTLTVVADIPVNTTLRLETYHFDLANLAADGTFSQQTFTDFGGTGGGQQTYTFDFFPMESTRINPTSTVARPLLGGPGSVDYGTNNSSSKVDRHRNTFEGTFDFTIRATDQAGEIADRSFKVKATLPWRWISNLTHGFVAGGYYNAESWRTICKCNMSTDSTTISPGTLANNGVTSPNTNRSGARYADASVDRWTGNGFVWSSYAYDGSDYAEAFNMVTESAYANGARLSSNGFFGQAFSDDTRRNGYYGGGTRSVYDKFSLVTFTRTSTLTGWNQQSAHAGWFTETHGYTYVSGEKNTANHAEYIAFATDTKAYGGYASSGTTYHTNSGTQGKGISTYGFGQNEAWLIGWNVVDNTMIIRHTTGTCFDGPAQTINNGEGNCVSGPVDSHGYSLGGYNGSPQNNHADRMNYANYTITRVSGADLRPHSGASSGGAMWAEL